MKIRVGFLGAGVWGRKTHLPALAYLRQNPVEGFEVELAAERDSFGDVVQSRIAQPLIPSSFQREKEKREAIRRLLPTI